MLDSLLSSPHEAETQWAKSAVLQLFPLKWSLRCVWHSFVDLSLLNLLIGKRLRGTWLGHVPHLLG